MNVTFIGGGNMADALIGGLLGKGFRPQELRVVEIDAGQRRKLAGKYGVDCFDKAAGAVRKDDIVVLAVKPQQLRETAVKSGLAKNENLVISIAAGVRLTSISRWLGGHLRLVRAMPNTPALIGEGIAGLYPLSDKVSAEDRRNAETILGAVGLTVWIEHEKQMDAVTAVSGSGPAYVFYFVEAVQEAAKELGLPPEVAQKLALHTFTGAAKLAAGSPDPVPVLRERVTSKGGTTEAALASMTKDKVKEAIIRAIRAADGRGKELGEQLDKDN
jgi:pyrroline-5-carboxylate reductase